MVAPARERFARERVIASPDNPRMRLAILGFGLIGGSVARALRAREPGSWTIAAWSPAGIGPRQAASEGLIDLAAPDPGAAISGADLVLLAAPPLACLALLDELAGPLRAALGRDAIVTDVASTKRQLMARARERGVRFVGGHPMAGREASGFGAADGSLFAARPWVICPPHGEADEGAVLAVERLARATGAMPIRLDPEVHDAAVAAISHLPLVLSAALVEAAMGDASGLDEATLKRLLDPIEADYDIIIVDTQPLLGFLVNIAFTWADEVIAPLQAESDAIESAALLLEHLHQLQQVGLNPDLRIAGFLFTQINAQTILHRSGMDFARDAFGRYVNFFESAIPRSTVYPEARARYKSIFEYRPGSRFAQVYDSMAQEVLSGSKSRKVAEMHLTEGFLDEVFEALDDIDEQTAPTPVVIQEPHEQE